MATEESFSDEDEAFFQGAASDAAHSVRPVTLDGYAELTREDEARGLARQVEPGRFVRPVRRVVAVLAALSAVALAREVSRTFSDGVAATPATLAANAAPALDIEVPEDDLACSPIQVGLTSDDSSASAVHDVSVAFIGPPAPPTPANPGKPRSKPRAKVAITTVRTAPAPSTARTKSLSTAAFLHAVRAQHAKAPSHK